MKFPLPIPIRELAERIGATALIGDDTLVATGINEIHKVMAGDVMFVDVKKYFKTALESAATIIILNEATDCPKGKALLVHPSPFAAYDALVQAERPFAPIQTAISDEADIHPSVIIEPNVVIGKSVRIAAGCYIQANAIIHAHTTIGENVQIGAGAIIGTDAFYFKRHSPDNALRYQKWTTGGCVIIEDNVDIGAGCTINLGVSGDTIIGRGSKLDAQCHIGHGVVVGKNCLFAAQVGIGGKTIVGNEVVLYGQVGIAQNLVIGDNVIVLAKSGVSKDLAAGKTYFGYPAQEVKHAYRELAILRQMRKNNGTE